MGPGERVHGTSSDDGRAGAPASPAGYGASRDDTPAGRWDAVREAQRARPGGPLGTAAEQRARHARRAAGERARRAGWDAAAILAGRLVDDAARTLSGCTVPERDDAKPVHVCTSSCPPSMTDPDAYPVHADPWPAGIRDAILAADPGPWTDPGPATARARPLDVDCPRCWAAPRYGCQDDAGEDVPAHPERLQEARERQAASDRVRELAAGCTCLTREPTDPSCPVGVDDGRARAGRFAAGLDPAVVGRTWSTSREPLAATGPGARPHDPAGRMCALAGTGCWDDCPAALGTGALCGRFGEPDPGAPISDACEARRCSLCEDGAPCGCGCHHGRPPAARDRAEERRRAEWARQAGTRWRALLAGEDDQVRDVADDAGPWEPCPAGDRCPGMLGRCPAGEACPWRVGGVPRGGIRYPDGPALRFLTRDGAEWTAPAGTPLPGPDEWPLPDPWRPVPAVPASDPLSGPVPAAGTAPGPVTPGDPSEAGSGDAGRPASGYVDECTPDRCRAGCPGGCYPAAHTERPREDCARGDGEPARCPYPVPCVGPCHLSTLRRPAGEDVGTLPGRARWERFTRPAGERDPGCQLGRCPFPVRCPGGCVPGARGAAAEAARAAGEREQEAAERVHVRRGVVWRAPSGTPIPAVPAGEPLPEPWRRTDEDPGALLRSLATGGPVASVAPKIEAPAGYVVAPEVARALRLDGAGWVEQEPRTVGDLVRQAIERAGGRGWCEAAPADVGEEPDPLGPARPVCERWQEWTPGRPMNGSCACNGDGCPEDPRRFRVAAAIRGDVLRRYREEVDRLVIHGDGSGGPLVGILAGPGVPCTCPGGRHSRCDGAGCAEPCHEVPASGPVHVYEDRAGALSVSDGGAWRRLDDDGRPLGSVAHVDVRPLLVRDAAGEWQPIEDEETPAEREARYEGINAALEAAGVAIVPPCPMAPYGDPVPAVEPLPADPWQRNSFVFPVSSRYLADLGMYEPDPEEAARWQADDDARRAVRRPRLARAVRRLARARRRGLPIPYRVRAALPVHDYDEG